MADLTYGYTIFQPDVLTNEAILNCQKMLNCIQRPIVNSFWWDFFFPISILYTLKFIFIKFIVVYLFWIYFNILQFMCEMTESFPCAIISAFRKPKNLLYVSLNIPVEVGDRYNYLYNIFFLAFRQFCLHFEHLNKMLSASSLWITTSILCRRKKKRKNMWIHSKYN